MFYYIDQHHTPSFPIGLVKTISDFTVRSVETGLGRWMLVLPVISVDAYPIFGFLRPSLSPWAYGVRNNSWTSDMSNKFTTTSNKTWQDFYFLLFCFVDGFKNQNRKFLCLDKRSSSCYLTLFMATKTKMKNFHDLKRTLFLVLLLHFWIQNQNLKFLCLDKTFNLLLVLLLGLCP